MNKVLIVIDAQEDFTRDALRNEEAIKALSADGLCSKTDEENLGFSYAGLNKYIRTGEIEDKEIKKKIDHLHKINSFKEKVIERYEYH